MGTMWKVKREKEVEKALQEEAPKTLRSEVLARSRWSPLERRLSDPCGLISAQRGWTSTVASCPVHFRGRRRSTSATLWMPTGTLATPRLCSTYRTRWAYAWLALIANS